MTATALLRLIMVS